MSQETKIERRDPATLRLHHLQKKYIPEPDKDGAEWHSFVDELSASGPENVPPIIISKAGEIMEGGRRWRGARQLAWPEIRCEVRDESEAARLIVVTLFGQRDMTRGAKVYIALGLIPDFVASAENRRLANLRQNRKTLEKPLILPKGSNSPSEAQSIAELSARFGISEDTYKRARNVRSLFYDPDFTELAAMFKKTRSKIPSKADLGELQIKLRREFEPKLFGGEKALNLWNVTSAIAGKLPGNQAGRDEGVQTSQLQLFTDGMDALRDNAPKSWKKFDEEKREAVIKRWRNTASALPADLRQAMKEVLEELEEA